MNSIARAWLTWKHTRQFARIGKDAKFPIPLLTVGGHLEMGDHCRMRNNSTVRTYGGGRVVFGNRSGLSWGCLVEAHELVQIGDYTGIAEHVYITDTGYDFAACAGGVREAARLTRPVRIGNECFIGSGCVIGPGVRIGDSAVIANHSVVTCDVPPLEIWSGAPARKVGHRTQNIPEARLREFQRLVEQQGYQRDRYKDDD